MEAVAPGRPRPLVGPLKLGAIPTLAPYLMPLILKPIHQAYPGLIIELWEDQTRALIEGLRNHRLDAALLATAPDVPEITEIELFDEPLLAALPSAHKLAKAKTVSEKSLGRRTACPGGWPLPLQPCPGSLRGKGREGARALQTSMQAATLDTLVNLVAAGYGATLIPALGGEGDEPPGYRATSLTGNSSARFAWPAARLSPPTGPASAGEGHPVSSWYPGGGVP